MVLCTPVSIVQPPVNIVQPPVSIVQSAVSISSCMAITLQVPSIVIRSPSEQENGTSMKNTVSLLDDSYLDLLTSPGVYTMASFERRGFKILLIDNILIEYIITSIFLYFGPSFRLLF